MQLTNGIATLLVSILCATSLVDARPAPHAGSVTLPLRAVEQKRSNLHPGIIQQRHANRALKRYARATNRELPSDFELRNNLIKRAIAIEASGCDTGLAKRYWTDGKMAKNAEALRNGGITLEDVVAHGSSTNKLASGAGGKGKHGAKAASAAAATGRKGKGRKGGKGAGGAAGGAGAGGAAAGASAAGAGTTVTNSSTGDVAGQPFSQIDLDASNNGGLTDANPPTADDSLGLDIEANDVGFIATVQMGTPPRNFNLLMDSGSADLWVGSENCVSTAGGGCGNHTFLGTQSSSSFVDTNNVFAVTYGTGNVNGTLCTDDISIAGLALPAHQFGTATQESDDFAADTVPFDGLMGLAKSALSQQGVPTPPESLAAAGIIKAAIVSYKIPRLSDQKNDGEITFGALDPTKFNANTLVTFPNVSPIGFWEGPFTLSVDGTDSGLANRTAILDTGTSLSVAPPNDAAAVHALIPGSQSTAQGFTIPCTTSVNLVFNFAGQDFAVDSRDLAFLPVDPTNLSGDCLSGITAGNIGGATEWLLGDVFLKSVYLSTNVDANTVSLATLA